MSYLGDAGLARPHNGVKEAAPGANTAAVIGKDCGTSSGLSIKELHAKKTSLLWRTFLSGVFGYIAALDAKK